MRWRPADLLTPESQDGRTDHYLEAILQFDKNQPAQAFPGG